MSDKKERRNTAGAPERIYLQHDPENTGEPFNEAHEVTWCSDKINDSDIEYVRADLLSEARERAERAEHDAARHVTIASEEATRASALEAALRTLLDRYTALVNCGDCGNWDPEEEAEVIAARRALSEGGKT